MDIADNNVNTANRSTVNHHRSAVATDTVAHNHRVMTATASHARIDVAFKRLPFYDLLTEIMKPSPLGQLYDSA